MHIILTRRVAATAMAGTALLIIAVLSHHPVVSQAHSAAELHAKIVQTAVADNLVHGTLTAMLVVLSCALSVFNQALHERRPALSAALAMYVIGCVLLSVAMLCDGFITPQLASLFANGTPPEAELGLLILRTTSIVIQIFSKAGILAHCVAFLVWAYANASSAQRLSGQRWFVVVSLAASLLPAAQIMLSDLVLTPPSLMVIFSLHALWYFSAAALLYRSIDKNVYVAQHA